MNMDPIPALPFRFGYGTNGFSDHTLADTLTVLHANGYRALALTLGHPHLDPFADDWREQCLALRAELDRLDMKVVVETGARYLLDPFVKHRPTLVDVEADKRMAFLYRAIEVCEILRGDCVSLWSGVLPPDVTAEQGWDLLLQRLPKILEFAGQHGVMIGVEPEPGMLIETVSDALRLRSALGEPAGLGITVDLGHCVAVEPGGVEIALQEAGDLLVNVQVDDMMPRVHEHLELGQGQLDLVLALKTLAQINYRGVAAVELPRHSHDAPGLAERSMNAMRQAWQTAGSEPEHPWLTEAKKTIEHNPAKISLLFAGAGRAVGRQPVEPDADPRGIVHGTTDDHARAELIKALSAELTPEHFAERITELYQHGDDAERRGVLRGLNGIADSPVTEPGAVRAAGLAIVTDALRTNDSRVVAAAMGAFARRWLDQYSWRHGVLKLIFMDVTLDVADGLTTRADDELRRMAESFAAERRAAGRTVSADVHNLTA